MLDFQVTSRFDSSTSIVKIYFDARIVSPQHLRRRNNTCNTYGNLLSAEMAVQSCYRCKNSWLCAWFLRVLDTNCEFNRMHIFETTVEDFERL